MTQPTSTIALENFEGINSEEDILITDVSRPPGSAREKLRLPFGLRSIQDFHSNAASRLP